MLRALVEIGILFLCVLLVLIPSWRQLGAERRLPWLSLGLRWLLTSAVLAYMALWLPGGIAISGLQPPEWGGVASGLLLGLASILAFPLVQGLSRRAFGGRSDSDAAFTRGLRRMLARPFWLRVLLVLTAAGFEEIVFRGFPIPRLTNAGVPLWLAVMVPLLFFTLVHLPFWGRAHLATVAFYGLIYSLVFVLLGNLNITILAHAMLDGFGFLILPVLMKRRLAGESEPPG